MQQGQVIQRSGASAAPRAPQQQTASALLPSHSIQELKDIAEQIKLVCETFGLSEAEEKHMRKAFMFCTIQNGLVPDAFKGDYRSIYIMSIKAERMKISLAEALQGGYFVHGRHAWYAEFMVSRVLELQVFKSIDYEEGGENADDLWCRAVGTRPDGSLVKGPIVDMAMAHKEGWTQKKGSKWGTMPAYMLQKRAATFLIRNTAAHVFGGSSETVDEVEERESTAQNPMVIDTKVSAVETMQAIAQADASERRSADLQDKKDRIEQRIAELINAGMLVEAIEQQLGIMSLDDINHLSRDQLQTILETLLDMKPPEPPPAEAAAAPEPDQEKQAFDDDIEKLRLKKLAEVKAHCSQNKLTNAVILEKTGMPSSMLERATLPELVKALKQLQG